MSVGKKTRNIALFTALPEAAHERKSIKGIAEQCEKYGYNLLVFCAMTHPEFKREMYARGESNIFNLACFDYIDSVILDTTSLIKDRNGETLRHLTDRIRQYPDLPAVALEMSIEGFELIKNRNEEILREMCRHVIDVHGKKNILLLTGHPGNEVSESRLAIFLDEIKKHGLSVSEDHIVYGDFWYTGGDKAARDILSGKISMPDAVISASDHMAIGLIERLQKNGIRIPEDLIVVSFDTTDEGRWCDVVLSSFDANDSASAASAVDRIRTIIDPGKEILPYEERPDRVFHPGMSCGCSVDIHNTLKAIGHNIYAPTFNAASDDAGKNIDIGMLMESYVFEDFTGQQTPDACLEQIYDSIYLLAPFRSFYLCLKDDWLDTDFDIIDGYPDRMRIVVSSNEKGEGYFGTGKNSVLFSTDIMIPQILQPDDEPSVYFFSPVHFDGKLLGYSVLNRSIRDYVPVTLVYRNWLRFVNNALEMTRSKAKLLALSVRDWMTGLYNRRGMEAELKNMFKRAEPDDRIFISMIDMDGLKSINDTYGHKEGDFALKQLSHMILRLACDNEICVRAGGDEFLIIGIGKYSEEDSEKRVKEFESILQNTGSYKKPYRILASIGCIVCDFDPDISFDHLLKISDEKMYQYKNENKRQRN